MGDVRRRKWRSDKGLRIVVRFWGPEFDNCRPQWMQPLVDQGLTLETPRNQQPHRRPFCSRSRSVSCFLTRTYISNKASGNGSLVASPFVSSGCASERRPISAQFDRLRATIRLAGGGPGGERSAFSGQVSVVRYGMWAGLARARLPGSKASIRVFKEQLPPIATCTTVSYPPAVFNPGTEPPCLQSEI